MAQQSRDPDDERLVCADVLGAFGVTAADIRREEVSDERLETVLAEVLADEVDRTSVLRRTITWGDRGFACPPQYSRADIAGELETVFDAIGWSLTVDTAEEGLDLTATDPRGRTREASVTYPDTPLGDHNLPAVMWTINETILAGTGARFVLLSPGHKRWRVALIEESELERLRDHYGPRIAAFDRPLCPEGGLAAYVSTERADNATETGGEASGNRADDGDPWPSWALEGDARGSADGTKNGESVSTEPEEGTPTVRRMESTTGESNDIEGFELRGSPSVSRSDGRTETDDRTSTGDEFGSLSGTSTTARVTNDSFGTNIDWQSDDDRYQALGAALGAGGNVSVRGLLEDDEFLPELPAVEPDETRIEFEEEFDPDAVSEAAAAAEESGFEWVDTGSVERTRVSNG